MCFTVRMDQKILPLIGDTGVIWRCVYRLVVKRISDTFNTKKGPGQVVETEFSVCERTVSNSTQFSHVTD